MCMEFSKIFQLKGHDFAKGLVVAALVALLGVVQQALTQHGLDFASYDWGMIGNVVWMAVVGYLSKNALTDERGKVLGKI